MVDSLVDRMVGKMAPYLVGLMVQLRVVQTAASMDDLTVDYLAVKLVVL